MARMIGKTVVTCPYGCCRDIGMGRKMGKGKKMENRHLKRKERQEWKREGWD